MFGKHLVAGLACAGLLVSGLSAPARAGSGDVVGGLIGGMIGAAIVNEASKQRPRTVVRQAAPKPAVSSYQREQNREVQTALNYFGYPVGAPDGVIGAKSRAAIGQYQALLGYPGTGQLTEIERQILVTAYQRAMIGGPQVQQVVSGPQGIRGMLLKQRDEMMGGAGGSYAANSYGGLPPDVSAAVEEIARNSNVQPEQLIQRAGFIQLADMNADGRTDYLIDTSVTGSGFWCNGPACTVRVFASTPEGYQRNDFQLAGATPGSFACQHGLCQIAQPGAPAAVVAAPVMPAPAPLRGPSRTGSGETERRGGRARRAVANERYSQGGGGQAGSAGSIDRWPRLDKQNTATPMGPLRV
ncbi:MAG: peptidoglycan-binding protein, partial [Sphingomonadales bacterium]|nr:peptidoglycan-binding protein [Sphingomonadales bacterium]